jgi:hypothetical protein
MTGERSLRAVISILWIAAVLIAAPALFLLGYAILTNEEIPDLWQQIIRGIVPSLWFAVPAAFLTRGSRVARWFAIFASVSGLAAAVAFAAGLTAGGAPELALLGVLLALPFLFSIWALLSYRDLQAALAQRSERWNAAERARMKALEDGIGPE